ncbi:uncharacterized protein RHOBADRAFT_55128 [Rhodotorula graminis WP1]|uniref:Polysaccharide lyase family 14 protein n=1 Tax=Rhodotorula graminis (strain WP1) TaxID=578459 RepID=A0A0P9GJV4_RHOGW|nr:uncharacterized protein RHOBADRAFT_55128 [Rhodotorula graminis WP1]KPV73376.1 hypothetical protein RHOBADRAFT_55128 [Rhodotorula graminis WP1]
MSAPPPVPPRPGPLPPVPPRPSPSDPPQPPAYPPVTVGRLLADGTEAKSGVLTKGIKWQASGILEEGANLPGQDVKIQRALTIHLGPSGSCIDGKGRQRNEVLSWPPTAPGETWIYKWNFHLAPSIPSASKFFHMTQLFSRAQSGYVVALGLVNGRVRISSQLPPLVDAHGHEVPLPEVDVERYWGRTTYHRMVVTWGPGGSVDYTVQDATTQELVLQYARSGVDVPAGGSIKCGLYRAHVCSAASAVVGDLQFSRR